MDKKNDNISGNNDSPKKFDICTIEIEEILKNLFKQDC